MREIKFRIWDKIRNSYYYRSNPNLIDTCQLWLSVEGQLTSIKYPNHEIHKKNFVLQEYTGLQDIDGKDIYEGDILFWPDYNEESANMPFGVIKFGTYYISEQEKQGDYHQGFYVEWKDKDTGDCYEYPLGVTCQNCHISGNIFQTPDLY